MPFSINGQSAELHMRVRKEQSVPLVARLEAWLRDQHSRLSTASSVAGPIDYMLRRWDRFVRFLDDGRIFLRTSGIERQVGIIPELEHVVRTDIAQRRQENSCRWCGLWIN
jgi:hypothetical protein